MASNIATPSKTIPSTSCRLVPLRVISGMMAPGDVVYLLGIGGDR